MSIGRSKFYVSAPLDYRHSMLADISPASSASTLPSIAGSVDCLTDPHNDKKKKKSKSFSIRPFSSTSLLNKSSKSADASVDKSSTSSLNKSADTGKRKKFSKFFSSSNSSLSSKCAPRTSVDSSCQTDERPPRNEVGVQTTHITADVPVQTGSAAWADDRYSRGGLASTSSPPLAAASSSYSFLRRPGPRGPYFARRSGETDAGKVVEIGGGHVLTPLDAGRVLTYAPPPSATHSSTAGPTPEKVRGGQDPEAGETTSSQPPPQSDPERTSESTIKECSSTKTDSVTDPGTSDKKPGPLIVWSKEYSPKSPPVNAKLDDPEGTSESKESDSVINTENGDKKPGAQVSAKLVSFLDKPSALKVERSDSPVRYSAKIKTVHFDLADGDSNHDDKNDSPSFMKRDVEPACLNDSPIPRNLDKDFEDLLRNLDILVDDPIDISEIPKADALKISFDACQSSPPKQTLLSSKLRSAFDVLHQEVLPPIPETYENCEVEPPAGSNKTNEQVTKINSAPVPAVDSKENKLPSTQLSEIINNPNIPKDDSAKPASVNVFTSSKSAPVEASENVYDSDFSENVIKTVTLPTLPSFFDSAPKSSQPEFTPEDSHVSAPEQPDTEREAEEKMLSRSSSRGSVRGNPASEFDGFFDAAKRKFDSCENLDQLEEEIIRSLCEPSDLAHKIPAHDAAHVRRVTLERLLSGDGGGRTPDEIIEIPESKINARQTYKHVATITKLDHHRNDPELECSIQTSNSNRSDNLFAEPSFPEMLNDINNGISPVIKNDSLNKTSAVYLPERKPLSNDNLTRASNGHSTDPPPHYSRESAEEDVSRTCDFTHCLRPSEVRNNSPFLDKINFRCSPEKSPLRSPSPAIATRTQNSRTQSPKTEDTKTEDSKGTEDPGIPNSNGRCDFGHCLKPSQVQNGDFLTNMAAIKLAPDSSQFATNTTLHRGANSVHNGHRGETPRDGATHKSEITIVLQTPSSETRNTKQRSPEGHKLVTVSPVIRETESPPLNSDKPASANERYGTVREAEGPSSAPVVQQSFVPPPPPLPSSNKLEPRLQNKQPPSSAQISLNPSSSLSAEPKFSPSKSPVMMELERCFKARRRHSADELDQQSNIESDASPGKPRNARDFPFPWGGKI